MNPTTTPTPPAATPRLWDLAVCYRLYPRVSRTPIFNFTEKLALAQLSLESFAAALGGLRVKIVVLLDNCPPAYEAMVRAILPAGGLELMALAGEGNEATFSRQIDILQNQTDAPLVYFAEDDYLYLPGAIEQAVRFMTANPEADFVTLYDHADYYKLNIHRFPKPLERLAGGIRWRTVRSTCLTFMARHERLVGAANVFRTYRHRNPDLAVWMALTQRGLLDPRSWLGSLADGRFCFGSHLQAWRHTPRQILFGRRHTLWAPAPSLATHMEVSGLAPGVPWETTFGSRAAALNAIHQKESKPCDPH